MSVVGAMEDGDRTASVIIKSVMNPIAVLYQQAEVCIDHGSHTDPGLCDLLLLTI